MDTTTPTIVTNSKRSNPWGLLIGLLLILAIIVAGAYYAFTQRIAPQPVEQAAY